MTGESVKAFILKKGYNVAQVADMIGTSQQNLAANLKHSDVRSGLLEKISSALGIPLLEFYGGTVSPVQTAVGDNNTQVGGDYQASNPDVLELLKMKDEQLSLTIKQVSKAQEQMDRLLDRFCGPKETEDSAEN
jgi:transcriptional regulator with XRE-family HTH domain